MPAAVKLCIVEPLHLCSISNVNCSPKDIWLANDAYLHCLHELLASLLYSTKEGSNVFQEAP